MRALAPEAMLLVVLPDATFAQDREVLAIVQAAGCDGCLYASPPEELVAVLRTCFVGPPCG